MGKVRRLRQKYHQLVKNKKEEEKAKNKEIPGLCYEDIVSGNFDKVKITSSSAQNSESNIFSGININIDSLKSSLIEDDRISVRSIAKSLKYDANGKLLKKDEKRKVRHDLFMQRLDFIQKTRNTKGRNKKKKKDKSVNSIPDELPELVKIADKDKMRVIKKKGIEKSKKRQKIMLEDISAFQKILKDPTFKDNPFKCVSDSVHNKLLEDVKNV